MAELTLTMLREHEACEGQLAEFERRFGESVQVTEDAAEAVAHVFDWGWAAQHFLSRHAYAEYHDVLDREWEECYRVLAQAEYKRVCDQAWADFDRVRARTFARLYAEGRSDE